MPGRQASEPRRPHGAHAGLHCNHLLAKSGFDEDLGILSVDIDGNDYFVLEAINVVRPRILICEYNALFGASRKISVPYEAGFSRAKKHYSNLYFGASLAALVFLANKKGYSLVGTNSSACNAFFVRNDLLSDKINVLSVAEAYSQTKTRQSRDRRGNLSHLSGDNRLEAMRGLPVIDVETAIVELL